MRADELYMPDYMESATPDALVKPEPAEDQRHSSSSGAQPSGADLYPPSAEHRPPDPSVGLGLAESVKQEAVTWDGHQSHIIGWQPLKEEPLGQKQGQLQPDWGLLGYAELALDAEKEMTKLKHSHLLASFNSAVERKRQVRQLPMLCLLCPA